MCDLDPNCLNSKTLILDTNFLDQINRIVQEEIASSALEKSIEEKRGIFLATIIKILENISRCSNNEVFTSTKVYDDEIDITNLNSALRTAEADFFNTLCLEEEFTRSLSLIYEDKIDTKELEQDEVEDLQELLSEDIGYPDASLLLLAIKQSQDDDVIIITDDLALQKVIRDLRRNREVRFGVSHFSTERLHYMGSLMFFKNLHSCCGMSNKRWMSTVWSFVRHQRRRVEEGMMSEEKYQLHSQYADPCLAQISADCDAKTEQNEMRYFSEVFGVNDG